MPTFFRPSDSHTALLCLLLDFRYLRQRGKPNKSCGGAAAEGGSGSTNLRAGTRGGEAAHSVLWCATALTQIGCRRLWCLGSQSQLKLMPIQSKETMKATFYGICSYIGDLEGSARKLHACLHLIWGRLFICRQRSVNVWPHNEASSSSSVALSPSFLLSLGIISMMIIAWNENLFPITWDRSIEAWNLYILKEGGISFFWANKSYQVAWKTLTLESWKILVN